MVGPMVVLSALQSEISYGLGSFVDPKNEVADKTYFIEGRTNSCAL